MTVICHSQLYSHTYVNKYIKFYVLLESGKNSQQQPEGKKQKKTGKHMRCYDFEFGSQFLFFS